MFEKEERYIEENDDVLLFVWQRRISRFIARITPIIITTNITQQHKTLKVEKDTKP